jgi:hypothetical protein
MMMPASFEPVEQRSTTLLNRLRVRPSPTRESRGTIRESRGRILLWFAGTVGLTYDCRRRVGRSHGPRLDGMVEPC